MKKSPSASELRAGRTRHKQRVNHAHALHRCNCSSKHFATNVPPSASAPRKLLPAGSLAARWRRAAPSTPRGSIGSSPGHHRRPRWVRERRRAASRRRTFSPPAPSLRTRLPLCRHHPHCRRHLRPSLARRWTREPEAAGTRRGWRGSSSVPTARRSSSGFASLSETCGGRSRAPRCPRASTCCCAGRTRRRSRTRSGSSGSSRASARAIPPPAREPPTHRRPTTVRAREPPPCRRRPSGLITSRRQSCPTSRRP